MRRIEIEIDAAMLAAADDAVEHGRFADRDAVIAHALALWREEEDDDFTGLPPNEQTRLLQLIEEGFASGDPVDGNFVAEDVIRRGRARLAAKRAAT